MAFARLPPEIRRQIYDYLLEDTAEGYRPVQGRNLALASREWRELGTLMAWHEVKVDTYIKHGYKTWRKHCEAFPHLKSYIYRLQLEDEYELDTREMGDGRSRDHAENFGAAVLASGPAFSSLHRLELFSNRKDTFAIFVKYLDRPSHFPHLQQAQIVLDDESSLEDDTYELLIDHADRYARSIHLNDGSDDSDRYSDLDDGSHESDRYPELDVPDIDLSKLIPTLAPVKSLDLRFRTLANVFVDCPPASLPNLEILHIDNAPFPDHTFPADHYPCPILREPFLVSLVTLASPSKLSSLTLSALEVSPSTFNLLATFKSLTSLALRFGPGRYERRRSFEPGYPRYAEQLIEHATDLLPNLPRLERFEMMFARADDYPDFMRADGARMRRFFHAVPQSLVILETWFDMTYHSPIVDAFLLSRLDLPLKEWLFWTADALRFLLMQGPTATLYGEDGNKIAQKNFPKAFVEGQELAMAGREIDYSITEVELWQRVKGVGSSTGTPAPPPVARAGFFSRTDQTRTTPKAEPSRFRSTTPAYVDSGTKAARSNQTPSLARPRSALSKPTNDVFRADSPSAFDIPSTDRENLNDEELDEENNQGTDRPAKTWFGTKKPMQKPFKFPTPIRRGSPALEYGAAAHSKSSLDSAKKDREELEAREREALRLRQASQEHESPGSLNKAKQTRISKVQPGQEEEAENSYSQPARSDSDEPTPPKKRKVEVSARKPRISAADLALSRSIRGNGRQDQDQQCEDESLPDPSTFFDPDRDEIKKKPRKKQRMSSPSSVTLETPDLFIRQEGSEDVFGDQAVESDDGMDWRDGDDLNEDGLFDHDLSSVRGGSDSESEGSRLKARAKGKEKASESSARSTTRYYTCQWRKQTTKKNATWDADGILKVDESGRLTLKDVESGKQIGSAVLAKSVKIEEDAVLKVGNKDVEIGSSTDRNAYAGQNDNASPPNKAQVPSSSKMSSSSRLSSLVPTRPSSSGHRSLSNGFAIPGVVAKPAGIGSISFYNNNSPARRVDVPLFDPNREGAIVMRRPDDEHQREYNKKKHAMVDVVIDPAIGDSLRPHQREGVRFMYECAIGMRTAGLGCILADEMGLGKTIQSIALIWTLLKQNPYVAPGATRRGVIDRAMIVCPVTLTKNWAAEFKKWLGKDAIKVMVADHPNSVKTFANARNYQVLILGYEKLTSAIEDVKYAQPPIGLIICDEGHRLKSAGTKTAQAVASLSCQRRVILSGTPIQNNLGEFFAMMNFVNPGLIQDANYFKKNYEQPIVKARNPLATKEEKRAGKEAAESLADIQRKFFLRRTSDILQRHLPPKHEYTVFVVPTRKEVEIYQQVLSSSAVRSLLSGSERSGQLSLLMMLRKCANTPGLLMQQADSKDSKGQENSIFSEGDLTRLFPTDVDPCSLSLSAKLSALALMLRDLRTRTDEKIVVVSNFTSTLDIIEKYCKRSKYPFCRLDGKTPQEERIPMVNAFNRGNKQSQFIFLLSSKSGGTGLNIIGASRLVLIDSDWNPSTDLQAMARIHREGQTRPCVIYRFLTAGTIDEKMYQRQITKMALSGSVMNDDHDGQGHHDDSHASGVEGKKRGGGDAFTIDDLKNIFRLHEDTGCQTHDLIECSCHKPLSQQSQDPTQSQDTDDDEDDNDDDDDDEPAAFVPASQLGSRPERIDKKARKRTRRNLSILKTWAHYDCSQVSAVEKVQDELLKRVIEGLYEKVDANERVVEGYGWNEMDEEDKERVAKGERLEVKGGQIAWVFEKKNKTRQDDADN
ncbi:uncharacterized protein JCM15063_000477 [Sporobolomyces koalae]|uniref:uncharacterized protein n=1 Tax=Sporobolomyces koalae TaxID=500713 RepID=UPI0031709B0A